jgi:hypothetical protein
MAVRPPLSASLTLGSYNNFRQRNERQPQARDSVPSTGYDTSYCISRSSSGILWMVIVNTQGSQTLLLYSITEISSHRLQTDNRVSVCTSGQFGAFFPIRVTISEFCGRRMLEYLWGVIVRSVLGPKISSRSADFFNFVCPIPLSAASEASRCSVASV